MLALELKAERCERVIEGMREKGFIINLTHNNVLRFLPSLLVKRKEISKMLSALDQELAKIDPEVI
jgi:acetylornithine/succinyldiaminopimelate/putrescine aminotransferase